MAVTAFWGSTFLIIQLAMQHSGPLFFVGLRFVAAGLVGTLVFWKRLQGLTRQDLEWTLPTQGRETRQDLVAGMVIGISICLGYVLQTWGLKTIPVSQSAFITGLYVPMVPLLQWLVMRRRPSVMNLVGVTLAFAGLVLMAGPQDGEFGMTFGAWLTLAGAVAITFEIVLIGHYAGRVDLGRVTVVQLYAAGLLSFLLMPVLGESVPDFSWVWLVGAIGLGFSSIVIQLGMNWAQKTVSPTRATVIYAGEPVWGGVAGYAVGERLPLLALAGGALIVTGVLVSELKLRQRQPRPDVSAG